MQLKLKMSIFHRDILRPWMVFLVDISQMLLIHMGIDLRGSNIGMPQHFLHAPQVGPALQQMRAKTMP